MKNITFLGCLMLLFTMTLNAQHLSTQEELEIYQNSLVNSESQTLNSSSIEELLTRLSDARPQVGSPNHLFSPSEMQTLKSHFRSQNRDIMANIIPTAGAVETFTPNVGDFFFDPGGPGGGPDGSPGNYPNCGCVTSTTLAGVSQLEFLDYEVFGNFDWLRIYDGVDATGVLLFDNGPGGNGANTFAQLLAFNGGSGVFNAASGNFFFNFNATAVVNRLGWEVEILATGGGGGGNPATDFTMVEVFPAVSPFPFGTSPIAGPFSFSPIGPGITQQVFAGDYDENDALYGLNFSNNTLITIDNATGSSSVVGPLTNLLTGHTVTGLSFNPVDGTMYALSTNGTISQIYTVNLASGALTLVGSGTGNSLGIWLEIDNAGNAYMADVGTDSLYSVNLATGAATVIGLLGIDINFAQDATIDPSDNTLYMAAYLANSTSGIYTVNVATGLATFSHDTAGKEFGILAIPGSGSGGGGGNNWECADAFALTCGDVVLGSTSGATNSGGNASPDVFYTYTGSGEVELVTISLCDGGTNYDSYLRVFADCGALGVGNEIALNDDFCGLQSQLTFESDGISTYIIMVEGFATSSGDFSLEITCESPPGCGNIFTDSGGPTGNYANNEDTTWTFFPENVDDYVIVTFTEFDVEATWDALYVYDGPDTSSPLISSGNPPTGSGFPAGGYYGTTIPGPFASTHPSGALTFRFLSDFIITRPGWVADITCLPVPPVNDLIVNAIDVDQFTPVYTDPGVRLIYATNELLNPQGCSIAGANGVWYKFTATSDGAAEASITTPAGASAVIFYSAPNENVADETELTYTFGQTNQCGPGTSSAVATVAGQSYYLFVLNTGGESDVVVDLSDALGTDENAIDGFIYYPNPMENVLNLSSKTSIDNVVIYTMLGQKVVDQNIGATSAQLQISNLATGAYLMKVVSQGQTGTYRLLKK